VHSRLFDVFSVQGFSVVWRCKDKRGLSQIVRQDESIFRFVPENARKDEKGRKKILEKIDEKILEGSSVASRRADEKIDV
jgi:hypothetical protein